MNLVHPDIATVTLEDVLYALSDSVRLQIVKALHTAEQPLTCTEAAKSIEGLAISTRSHSFKILRERGVIYSRQQGRECYSTVRLEELEQRFPKVVSTILQLQ
ncbi:MAG TPA: winged helix-turn-helix domain-containing protein [Verrucomicrobiae bacterium]|nr:winged helix-turn-helix domain-containing protein [Verrucomicrobiae bacterium]